VGERRFNEREVREILKKASSSQSREEVRDADGISLVELQEVATELGLDPRHIELAAQQLGPGAPSRASIFNGRTVWDRTVDGEVGANEWLGMVAIIQRFYKGAGAITQRGSNYDWAASEEGGSLALTVNVRNGRSRIRLESNRWLEIFMASVFCPVFALVCSAVLTKHGHAFAAIPICLVFGATLFGLVRLFRQHHLQSVSGLMDRLIDEVQPEISGHRLDVSTAARSGAAASELPVRS
jgi:hypothetical protein